MMHIWDTWIVSVLAPDKLLPPLAADGGECTAFPLEKVRWGQARWGQRFFEKLPKGISEIWTVFKLINKLPKNYNFNTRSSVQMHREAVQFVFLL